ncbi:MAG: hypothetical protein HYY37_03235 [Candidatus Aenigmarchaeota archaeon]|nr:hypothetical protein [Candidatus Aenigmarchaeota archaeon]
MNPLVTMTLVVLMSIGAIALVITVVKPVADRTVSNSVIRDATSAMEMLDNAIREVASEGAGSKRVVKFTAPREFEVTGQEDSLQFKLESGAEVIEYLSRRLAGDIVQIAGNDVRCDDAGSNLTQENSFVSIAYKKVPKASTLASITTENMTLMIKEKTNGTAVYPANSSIIINGDTSSKNGTGYSEVLWKGTNLPLCIVHFYINSTYEYDVYYTLYAGADFVVADVRHVVTKT